ncbi:MAG TPA: hypothetical protein VGV38_12285, partial [Pyrinomonadaceae bacterium]|nr:hypothetical protein [Pyrinomonadaceae bacterium]
PTLEVALSYDDPWPTLRVVYQTPPLEAAHATSTTEESASALRAERESVSRLRVARGATHEKTSRREGEENVRQESWWRRLLAALARAFARLFGGAGRGLRPGALAAAMALVLVAVLLFVRLHAPTASAAELLRRSATAEASIASDPALASHRTLYVEEFPVAPGRQHTRRRVEIWQSARRGLRVLRVYDEQDRLLAGEWARADGTSTVYRAGLAPQDATNATTQGPPATDTSDAARDSQTVKAALAAGDFWRLEPSARNFGALVGDTSRLNVEEGVGSYVLSYRDDAAGATSDDATSAVSNDVTTVSLVAATLRLSKADLRATEQTLVVRRGAETRELRFVESGFERRRAEEVAPRVFEPEPALLGAAGAAGETNKTTFEPESRPAEGTTAQPSSSSTGATPVAASAELEIEVTYLLNQIKADLGEQVGLTRTTGGILRVEALVESEGRKQEILRALGPVLNNPSVVVEVSTVAEAARRERRQNEPSDVREVEVEDGRFAAEAELRKYFSARLVGEARIRQEMERFAARAMGRSRQALLHANALRRLASRFTP